MSGIRFYREQRKMTQEELAKAMGVTQGTVTHWENGRRVPKLEHMKQMSRIFGVSIEQLLEAGENEVDEKSGV